MQIAANTSNSKDSLSIANSFLYPQVKREYSNKVHGTDQWWKVKTQTQWLGRFGWVDCSRQLFGALDLSCGGDSRSTGLSLSQSGYNVQTLSKSFMYNISALSVLCCVLMWYTLLTDREETSVGHFTSTHTSIQVK